MNGAGITVVGASAGSGKTYRLTQEVTSSVVPGAAERVDLPGLVAVTFTRKAHAELEARIRRTLASAGAHDEALQLPLAYVGTVHAAALRMLQEFALDAGLSPSVDVVTGHEGKLLRQAFERTLDEETRDRLDHLANRLELGIDPTTRRTDWVTPVADIMDLARSNRIAPDALPAMAERSIASFSSLLPPPVPSADALEAELRRELDAAKLTLASADATKTTAEYRQLVEDARAKLADGELRWSHWAKLAARKPAVASAPLVARLRAIAGQYTAHPRLHDDLRDTTRAIFEAAREGLVAYQRWKSERRVVDYVDMLDRALDVVEHPRVRSELERRLQLVVVDEFQDTSPIQLALFVRLHGLAGRSVWVGDRKQCIFEYAGADPELMDAVTDWVVCAGGRRDRLVENRRSRPALVRVCSTLFASALARHGFTREEVEVSAHRDDPPGLAALPPLGLWSLETPNLADASAAIAEGVRLTLASAEATPVLDRETGVVRPLRPGDVAILVTTNDRAAKLAVALHARGVRAALARTGLLDTPEGALVDAALRWLVDGRDELSAAVLDALTGWGGRSPDAWLEARLRDVATKLAHVQEREEAADAAQAQTQTQATASGWRRALEELRERCAVLAPSEVFEAALGALDAVLLCARWPDPAQRVANLDALRAAVQMYEARAGQEREAATIAGLLRYFDELRTPTAQRDGISTSDDQHVPADEGAVVICTYHKAKGLEWPVVVLSDLDKSERRDAFDVCPASDGTPFNPEQPLAGRAIRYWPWPLGQTKTGPLKDAAAASPEGRAVAAREDQERARLLYVGFTRARDHLVFAVHRRGEQAKTAWLDALRDDDDEPLLQLPLPAAGTRGDETGTRVIDAETRVRSTYGDTLVVPTRVRRLGVGEMSEQAASTTARWFARSGAADEAQDGAGDGERERRGNVDVDVGGRADDVRGVRASVRRARPAYRIAPSAGTEDWPELARAVTAARLGTIERLPGALEIAGGGYDDELVGNTVHAFLAADVHGLDDAARLARAERIVTGAGLVGAIDGRALVDAGERLRQWVTQRWPDATWWREISIEGVIEAADGERRVGGIIDLLLETREGYVVVDHKTFPAKAESAWRAKCREFVPQLLAYAAILEQSRRPVRGLWVHLPVGGGAVEVRR